MECKNEECRTVLFGDFENKQGLCTDCYIEKLEAENKRLRDALVRLVSESIHFKNTKFGDRHLLAAIDQANQALEQ